MKNDLETIRSIWRPYIDRGVLSFPVVYMEIPFALDLRGFIELNDFIGDVDIAGYPLRGEDILIDSKGHVYTLVFNDFVRPGEIKAKLSVAELREYVTPALISSNESVLLETIRKTTDVNKIVKMTAEAFAW